jgi:hypothetical protein
MMTVEEEQGALHGGKETPREISGLENGGLGHHPSPKGQSADNPMTRGKPALYFEDLENDMGHYEFAA